MFKVITYKDKKIVDKFEINEEDDNAFQKALVQCDRFVWKYQDAGEKFLVALMQDDRLLRWHKDSGWNFPKNNSIYV